MGTERPTGDVVVLPVGRTDAPTLANGDERSRGDGVVPRKIGRYAVLEVVGRGGMGVVCTAYDPKLDRRIALKLLREHDVTDARRATTGQARLVREARALARLSHPNIVMVHDVDVVDGRLYIAMEYLEGQSVAQWLDKQRRGWRDVLAVFVEAARGLAAAHQANIVHRDFKPANVLLGPGGRVCVVDFGLAKRGSEDDPQQFTDEHAVIGSIDDSGKLTQVGRRVGTPAYMAPEQMLGQTVGPAADQFAFGVSLYEALYRIAPFRGNDRQEAMWQAIEGHVAPPPKDHDVPSWVHKVVLRCLAREPEARFPGMQAVIAALQDDPARRRSRLRTMAIAGGLVALAGAGAAAFVLQADPCPGADDRVAAVWNAEREQALAGAFGATGLAFADSAWDRTAAAVDAHTAEWLATHGAICRATHVRGEQSEALLDTRMACLDRNLHELGVLLDVFATPDALLVERATEAALRVSDPARCGELSSEDDDGAPSPEQAARAAEIGNAIAAASAHLNAGRDKAALEIAEDAWQRARALGHGPLEIRTSIARAHARGRGGDSEGSEADLREAIAAAATLRRAREEAQAWVMLVPQLGHGRLRVDEALALRLAAEAALHRAGDPPDLRADLAHGVAMALANKGDSDGAIAEFERALELRMSVLDEHHPDVARTRGDLAIALVRAGRFDRAQEELVRALADTEAGLGRDHPLVASFAHSLGNVRLESRRDLEGAAAMFERALAIREAAYGKDSPKIAEVLVSMSALQRHTGDDASALATSQRAVAILAANAKKADPKLASALNNLGTGFLAVGRAEEALAAHERALELFLTLHGEEHASVGRTRARRCEVLGALGRHAEAMTECDQALAVFAKIHREPHRETINALRTAAVVDLAADERGRALEHARQAVALERQIDRSADDRVLAEFVLLRVLAGDPKTETERASLRTSVSAALGTHPDRHFVAEARAWLRANP